MTQRQVARLFVLGVIAMVIFFATLTPAPLRPIPPQPEDVRALFDELVSEEAANREAAKEDWAHHPWSQQDAFGALELGRVNSIASSRQRSRQDLFLVIDDGLRAKWPAPDGGLLRATIIPLKPRPLD